MIGDDLTDLLNLRDGVSHVLRLFTIEDNLSGLIGPIIILPGTLDMPFFSPRTLLALASILAFSEGEANCAARALAFAA